MTFKELNLLLDEGTRPTQDQINEIAYKLSGFRGYLHLTQEDMAKLTGMSRISVNAAERGKTWSHNYVIYFFRYMDFPKFFDMTEAPHD